MARRVDRARRKIVRCIDLSSPCIIHCQRLHGEAQTEHCHRSLRDAVRCRCLDCQQLGRHAASEEAAVLKDIERRAAVP